MLHGLMRQAPTTSRVRLSRSLGLPDARQTSWVWHCGSLRNLASSVMCFLATTGTGHLGRYVLLPARRNGLRAYTSLFPYRTLAARPEPDGESGC